MIFLEYTPELHDISGLYSENNEKRDDSIENMGYIPKKTRDYFTPSGRDSVIFSGNKLILNLAFDGLKKV